jgi:hypothetical protein
MESTKHAEGSASAAQSCCAPAAKSGWLNSRNVLIGAIAVGGGGALFFGRDWLVAAGFASVIIGVLPCLVMCTLGICASRMGKKDSATRIAASVPPKDAGVASASAESGASPVAAANQAESNAAKRVA